ncbi:hypothetical protein NDU88_012130 [Pleurodeles waltl]|uniref:Uncharacterized protein n=1 Tax=Pleurodeles waltl TaxID=8319 RepID=A0AAV7R2E3_PLEWA|nr:hypothetical protein NDU88_012130 [Pleurodeles waltl]
MGAPGGPHGSLVVPQETLGVPCPDRERKRGTLDTVRASPAGWGEQCLDRSLQQRPRVPRKQSSQSTSVGLRYQRPAGTPTASKAALNRVPPSIFHPEALSTCTPLPPTELHLRQSVWPATTRGGFGRNVGMTGGCDIAMAPPRL